MGMPRDIEARRYYRVAYQRLDEGFLILRQLEKPTIATYLTGYAVECILKALLIASTPPQGRAMVLRSFRGGAGHDLLGLAERVAQCGARMPPDVRKQLVRVTLWSTDLRYEPGEIKSADARQFMAAAQTIVEWADGSM